jgi:glutamyl-tRNA synthetase
MPLLRNPDRSKISKRKNPVSLDYYRDAGFFPEALLNFLALMGFSFGGDREKFTLAEMMEAFDFSRVSAGEPVFDLQKLSWLNGLYLREMPVEELLRRLRAWRLSDEFLMKLLPLEHHRIERMDQFIPAVSFFLTGDLELSGVLGAMVPKGREAKETSTALADLTDYLEENIRSEWTNELLEAACRAFSEKIGWKTKELFMPIRLAVTGRAASPPLFDTMRVVGKDLARRRLRLAATALASYVPPAAAAPGDGKAQPGKGGDAKAAKAPKPDAAKPDAAKAEAVKPAAKPEPTA